MVRGCGDLLVKDQTAVGKQPLKCSEPLPIVSRLAFFAIALRLTRDLGGKYLNPFRPSEAPSSVKRDHPPKCLSVPRLGETRCAGAPRQVGDSHVLSM